MSQLDRLEQDNLQLHQWIPCHLEKQTFGGLEWLDKHEGLFKIVWADKDKPGSEQTIEICEAWVRNKDVEEEKSFSNLKSRFRNAMKKSNHFDEVKELSKNNQQTGNCKVYKILNKNERKAKKAKLEQEKKRKKSNESCTNSYYGDGVDQLMDIPNDQLFQNNGVMGADTQSALDSPPLLPQTQDHPHQFQNEHPFDQNASPASSAYGPTMQCDSGNDASSFKFKSVEEFMEVIGIPSKDLSLFNVTIYYDNHVVHNSIVDLSQGRRFIHFSTPFVRDAFDIAKENSMNPLEAAIECFEFPQFDDNDNKSSKYIKDIMSNISLGVILQAGLDQNGTVVLWAKRCCQIHVYSFGSGNDKATCIKLKRNEPIVLFSYASYMCQLLENSGIADSEIMLSIGSQPLKRTSSTWVRMVLEPVVADAVRDKLGFGEERGPVGISGPSSGDKLMKYFADLSLKETQNAIAPTIMT